MEEESQSNHPKTYGIVYKDSAEVINYLKHPQYFRSKWVADQTIERLRPIFMDVDLEVIQFNPTSIQKRNLMVIRDLANSIGEKKKHDSKFIKKKLYKHDSWLKYLHENSKNYENEFKLMKQRELKRIEESSEECF